MGSHPKRVPVEVAAKESRCRSHGQLCLGHGPMLFIIAGRASEAGDDIDKVGWDGMTGARPRQQRSRRSGRGRGRVTAINAIRPPSSQPPKQQFGELLVSRQQLG